MYPFAVTYCCHWCIVFVNLSFTFTSRSHLSDVSFVAEKTHPDMFSLTLTLPYTVMLV